VGAGNLQQNLPSSQPGALVFAWEIPQPKQRYWEIHISRNTPIAVIASLLVHAFTAIYLKTGTCAYQIQLGTRHASSAGGAVNAAGKY